MDQDLSTSGSITELRPIFDSIISLPIDPVKCNVAGEEISTIYRNDWVKIFIIRSSDFADVVLVEVEVSLPKKLGDAEVILDMIQHLTYLQELLNQGFELCVIREECLWVANRSFSETPDDSILEVLHPPMSQSNRSVEK